MHKIYTLERDVQQVENFGVRSDLEDGNGWAYQYTNIDSIGITT